MGPTSMLVLVGVLLAAVGLLIAVALSRRLAVNAVAGVLTLTVATFWGALMVNAFYGYYDSWGAAVADLTGSGNHYAIRQANRELAGHGVERGRLVQLQLGGGRSGISRSGLVYLPPQYANPAYRAVRFPVVELLHGSPGDPGNWVAQMHVVRLATELIVHRQIGPMVLVMPDINGGLNQALECLDSGRVKDDTYITTDVRTYLQQHYRVSRDATQWGVLGYSSGGYCAANLALRHRTSFGAFAALDGYYRPQDGPAARVLGHRPAAMADNDPLTAVLALRPGDGPLPAAWISAGTGNGRDYRAGKAFVTGLRRLESVPFMIERGAHHNVAAWRAAVPVALRWMWQQLCTPAQRVMFPTGGRPAGGSLPSTPARPASTREGRR